MNIIFRKTSLAVAGAAAIGLSALGTAAAEETITVVSWGGAYTKSQIEAYHKPWAAKTGNKVTSVDYNGGLAEIKAQVESGNVTWDVVDVELSDAIRGCDEGLLEEIDPTVLPPAPDGTPAKKDFIQGTLVDCAVATIVWGTVYAYDKSKFKDKVPTTLADFFDLKTFPGKRGLRKAPKVTMEWALMADGVPAKDVYKILGTKEGQDRAFEKLDTIKDSVVWWEAGAQPPQLLADGEVVMTSAYNGRIFNAQVQEQKPFEIVWDGQVWDIDLYAIPKGSKKTKLALDFIKFSTDTQHLADQARYISYGPARRSSAPLVGKHAESGIDMKPHMPTNPENFKTALQTNFQFWADNQDELNERFAAWLAK